MNDHSIRRYLESRLEAILSELTALVEHESPSREQAALDALAARVADRWDALGGQAELVPCASGGAHVLGRFAASSSRPPALVIGHLDTVWPIGTLGKMPVRREGGRLHGPGVFDMKA